MPDTENRSIELPPDLRRVIGSYGGSRKAPGAPTAPGPLTVCVGGIHGNERAGVVAARSVLDRLAAASPPFRGRFVALAGNLSALAIDARYRDRDLNRTWTPDRVVELSSGGPPGEPDSEDREMRDLLAGIRQETAEWKGPVHFIDLHTNSAGGAPFACIGDTLRNRAFAMRLGLPVVLGLEEQIDGALLEYMNSLGHVTVGVEAGGHREPSSVERHEAVLWLALVAAGHVETGAVPDLEERRSLLREATAGIPGVVEVRSHHRVESEDRFRMREGFRNFDAVLRGSAVASDRRGDIRVDEDCRLLLPLYQAQGSDGFFTVRRVSPFWLRLSAVLRRTGLPALMKHLPGVSTHPGSGETLIVDTRTARFVPLQIFHLMGFRKRRWRGDRLLVSRRRHDVDAGRAGPIPS